MHLFRNIELFSHGSKICAIAKGQNSYAPILLSPNSYAPNF